MRNIVIIYDPQVSAPSVQVFRAFAFQSSKIGHNSHKKLADKLEHENNIERDS